MNTIFLTTAQAAERAQVSRPTVSRALKRGDLRAVRDNAGQWRITPEAVDAWAGERSPVHHEHRAHSVQPDPAQINEQLRAELTASRETIARLEGEAAMSRERLADLSADRDRWHSIAERLSHREPARPAPGFIARLFRRD